MYIYIYKIYVHTHAPTNTTLYMEAQSKSITIACMRCIGRFHYWYTSPLPRHSSIWHPNASQVFWQRVKNISVLYKYSTISMSTPFFLNWSSSRFNDYTIGIPEIPTETKLNRILMDFAAPVTSLHIILMLSKLPKVREEDHQAPTNPHVR